MPNDDDVCYGNRKYHFQLSVWMHLSIHVRQLQCFSLWYFFICWLTVWWKHYFCKCGKRKQTVQLIAVNIMLVETAFKIQINHQPNATIFQFFILTSVYSSTCFGRFPAHHQELNDCSGSLWFYLRIMVLCSWSGRPAGPTMNTAPRYEGKTRGSHCSHWALDDGRENARNMLSCKQTSG